MDILVFLFLIFSNTFTLKLTALHNPPRPLQTSRPCSAGPNTNTPHNCKNLRELEPSWARKALRKLKEHQTAMTIQKLYLNKNSTKPPIHLSTHFRKQGPPLNKPASTLGPLRSLKTPTTAVNPTSITYMLNENQTIDNVKHLPDKKKYPLVLLR